MRRVILRHLRHRDMRERKRWRSTPRWPNGTQVPAGPPPDHQEWAGYEIEEVNRAMRWLGPEPSRVLQREGLGERRQPVGKERPSWLEEEATRLKRLMDEQHHQAPGGLQAEYWSTPASVMGEGRDQHVPLSRASHGQVREVPLSRASDGQGLDAPLSRVQHGAHGRDPHANLGGELGPSYQGHREGHQQLLGRGLCDPLVGEKESEKEKALKEEIERLKMELQAKGVDLERAAKGPGVGSAAPGTVPIQNDGTMNSTRELPELQGDVTPITLGDWLVTIGPVMRDITPISSVWWDITVKAAEQAYLVWRQATPMERVSFCPGLPSELAGQQYLRTEQRGVGLLLKAIPADIKAVLVSARELCATTILFRLLTTYQPGGANEKALLLSHLTTTPVGKDLTALATSLRTWRRYFQRAVEIDTTLPDPTLMVRSLDGPTQGVAAADAQAAFRLSQMRAQLCLDEKPSQDTVYRYSQCILAEVETLVLTRAASGTTLKTPSTPPTLKALSQASPGATSSPGKVCGFWGTDSGCKLGRGCRYVHDWANITDKNARCWNCSSTLHQRGDCPARSAGGSEGKGEEKGEKGKVKGKGKESKGQKGEYKGNGKAGVSKMTKGESTSQPTQQEVANQQKGDSGNPVEQGSTGGNGTSNGGSNQQETAGLMAEVTSLLKSMRVSSQGGPSVSAIRLKKVEKGKEASVLLDGGATNCMRRAASWKEYEEGRPVQVHLAAGTTEMRQHMVTGTLLVMDDVQPIVPISDLVKIGVEVQWTASGCVMKHGGRNLPIYLDAGCPMIGLREGMELLRQVEELYKRRNGLRAAAIRANPDEVDLERVEAQNFAADFPEVPARLVERIPGLVHWDPHMLPLNRRMRKRIQRAKTIILHLFSGTDTTIWDTHGEDDMLILNIELKRGQDLHNDHLFGFLEQLCQSGRVRGVYAGPPCRTVTLLRFQQEEGGPPPLRAREGPERFGLPWLTEKQQEEADGDSVLWLRTLQLMTVALDETHRNVELPSSNQRTQQDGRKRNFMMGGVTPASWFGPRR